MKLDLSLLSNLVETSMDISLDKLVSEYDQTLVVTLPYLDSYSSNLLVREIQYGMETLKSYGIGVVFISTTSPSNKVEIPYVVDTECMIGKMIPIVGSLNLYKRKFLLVDQSGSVIKEYDNWGVKNIIDVILSPNIVQNQDQGISTD